MAIRKARTPFNRQPRLSMAVQDGHIRAAWPTFTRRGNEHASEWKGCLQPTPVAGRYAVAVEYRMGYIPKAKVVSPELVDNAPHIYSKQKLCLYHPADWNWHGNRILAYTIFPWVANWLFFYDLWLDTGEWLGPEAPHSGRKVAA